MAGRRGLGLCWLMRGMLSRLGGGLGRLDGGKTHECMNRSTE